MSTQNKVPGMGEVLARVRRTETRVTDIVKFLGIPDATKKPEIKENDGSYELHIPSQHVSLKELIDSIPDRWDGSAIEVILDGGFVVTIGGIRNR